MLTDIEIQHLIRSPKKITERIPAKGYKEKDSYKHCNLTLESTETEGEEFLIFIRQHSVFIENYSMGLRYKTNDKQLGTITLIRYNGPHGEKAHHKDGHYNKPHIHRITAEEIALGSNQPQERDRKITEKYNTFEQARRVFFDDTNITNWSRYFPELNQSQMGIFDEH